MKHAKKFWPTYVYLVVILACFSIAIGECLNAADSPAKIEHRVTMIADPQPDVLRLVWIDGEPSEGQVENVLRETGAVNFKINLDKSACDDSIQCAAAVRASCQAIGRKVKTQAWDLERGCSGTCQDGTRVEVTCVSP